MGASSTSVRKGDPPKNPGGRPKGSPNKLTADIRRVLREAFEEAGGKAYLVKIAKDDPKTFCALLGRIIPRELELEHKGKSWEELLAETLEASERNPRPTRPPAPMDASPEDAGGLDQ